MLFCGLLHWYMKPHYCNHAKSIHQLPNKLEILSGRFTLLGCQTTNSLPVPMNLQVNRPLLHHFRPLHLRPDDG